MITNLRMELFEALICSSSSWGLWRGRVGGGSDLTPVCRHDVQNVFIIYFTTPNVSWVVVYFLCVIVRNVRRVKAGYRAGKWSLVSAE